MHCVKDCVAAWQLLPQLELLLACWAATGAWAAGRGSAGVEPPEKKPPIAWPMEDPIATPLWEGGRVSNGLEGVVGVGGRGMRVGGRARGRTYAAVLAIWPIRPGPWETGAAAGAAAGGAAAEGAYVVAGRVCCCVGAADWRGATVGRVGALPEDLDWRGILVVGVGCVAGWLWWEAVKDDLCCS